MNSTTARLALIVAASFALMPSLTTNNDPVTATNAANTSALQLLRDSRITLASLYSQNPGARAMGRREKAVLVFPSITRAGFVIRCSCPLMLPLSAISIKGCSKFMTFILRQLDSVSFGRHLSDYMYP